MSGQGVRAALLAALRREGLDTVEGAFAYLGGTELNKDGLGHRRRTRLELTDEDGRAHVLYLKRYDAEAPVDTLRCWMTHGWGRSRARVESDNIRAARRAGIPTMRSVLWGEQSMGRVGRRSFLIVTAVPGDAMERSLEGFLLAHAGDGRVAEVTRRLARVVRRLHDSGHVHRDLYASHVFLDDSADEPRIHLIDLARMFAPRWRRFRWYIKDLAQLKYSMPAAWVEQSWQQFLAEYLVGVDAEAVGGFDAAIDRKVASIRRRAERRRARADRGRRP